MEISSQAGIGSSFHTVHRYGEKFVNGSAGSKQKDHVNALISNKEIEEKLVKKEEQSRKVRELFLENQVAVSKDGDTLQISKDASKRFEEEEAKKQLQKIEEKPEIKREVSFVGKSDQDLAGMYLRGDISKAEYDAEKQQRELKRKENKDREKLHSEEVLGRNAEIKERERYQKELSLAFSDENSHKLSGKDRMETIEVANGEKDIKTKTFQRFVIS